MDAQTKEILKEMQEQIYDVSTKLIELSSDHLHEDDLLTWFKNFANDCHLNMLKIDPDYEASDGKKP